MLLFKFNNAEYINMTEIIFIKLFAYSFSFDDILGMKILHNKPYENIVFQ